MSCRRAHASMARLRLPGVKGRHQTLIAIQGIQKRKQHVPGMSTRTSALMRASKADRRFALTRRWRGGYSNRLPRTGYRAVGGHKSHHLLPNCRCVTILNVIADQSCIAFGAVEFFAKVLEERRHE